MANHDFVLKSGAKLHITTAPFRYNIKLTSVVKKAMEGREPEEKLWDFIIFDDDVVEALEPVFQTVTYNGIRVTDQLFDDVKLGEQATADYPEIALHVLNCNCTRFFLKTSLSYTESKETNSESQKSQ